jgi:Ca2+-binding RTX toxin-like protein
VHVTGPNGFDATPTLVKAVPAANNGEVRATYRIEGPGGTWDPSDAGTYHVVMNANQVSDTFGNFVAGGDLGFFLAAVPFTRVIVGLRSADLLVHGTDGPEDITFAVDRGLVRVFFDRKEVGSASLAGLGRVIVRANGGDDTVTVAPLALRATVEGGPGNDFIIGSELADILRGGPGDDQFNGLGGADQILGEAGNDRVISGSGDVINLGPGQDGIVIHGTAGNDVIHISRRVGLDGPEAVILLNDELIVSTYSNGETITVFAGSGADRVVASNKLTWQVEFFGEEGDDVLVGGPRDDILVGGPGSDVLDGGGGLDQLFQEDFGTLARSRDRLALLTLLERPTRNRRK